jgi:hypothetical protein
MKRQTEQSALTAHDLARIAEHIGCRLMGRLCDIQVTIGTYGLVLQGSASTYHAKQLALHVAREVACVPVSANEIEVLKVTG